MNDEKDSQDKAMNAGLSVAEKSLLQAKLGEMPDTMPPRAVWDRIEEQARAEGLFRAPTTALDRYKWFVGPAVAAMAALVALSVLLHDPVSPPDSSATVVGEEPRTVPETANRSSVLDLDTLKVQSQELERSLRQLPPDPRVNRVSTATTIRELEDRIAAIDYRLNDQARPLDRATQQVYWRERVRLMNILVRLRYAQAQRMAF